MLLITNLRQEELNMPIESHLISREWCLVVRPSRNHEILSNTVPLYTNGISTP